MIEFIERALDLLNTGEISIAVVKAPQHILHAMADLIADMAIERGIDITIQYESQFDDIFISA